MLRDITVYLHMGLANEFTSGDHIRRCRLDLTSKRLQGLTTKNKFAEQSAVIDVVTQLNALSSEPQQNA